MMPLIGAGRTQEKDGISSWLPARPSRSGYRGRGGLEGGIRIYSERDIIGITRGTHVQHNGGREANATVGEGGMEPGNYGIREPRETRETGLEHGRWISSLVLGWHSVLTFVSGPSSTPFVPPSK